MAQRTPTPLPGWRPTRDPDAAGAGSLPDIATWLAYRDALHQARQTYNPIYPQTDYHFSTPVYAEFAERFRSGDPNAAAPVFALWQSQAQAQKRRGGANTYSGAPRKSGGWGLPWRDPEFRTARHIPTEAGQRLPTPGPTPRKPNTPGRRNRATGRGDIQAMIEYLLGRR